MWRRDRGGLESPRTLDRLRLAARFGRSLRSLPPVLASSLRVEGAVPFRVHPDTRFLGRSSSVGLTAQESGRAPARQPGRNPTVVERWSAGRVGRPDRLTTSRRRPEASDEGDRLRDSDAGRQPHARRPTHHATGWDFGRGRSRERAQRVSGTLEVAARAATGGSEQERLPERAPRTRTKQAPQPSERSGRGEEHSESWERRARGRPGTCGAVEWESPTRGRPGTCGADERPVNSPANPEGERAWGRPGTGGAVRGPSATTDDGRTSERPRSAVSSERRAYSAVAVAGASSYLSRNSPMSCPILAYQSLSIRWRSSATSSASTGSKTW